LQFAFIEKTLLLSCIIVCTLSNACIVLAGIFPSVVFFDKFLIVCIADYCS